MAENQDENDRTQSHIVLTHGTMVSHYLIVEKIGAGGMGEVYLAEDTKLKRQVALKFLPIHYSADEDFKRRFTREAEATARLSHPNIVTIHEVGEHHNRPYFAMELVEGQSLRQYRQEKELSVETIFDLTIQIFDGLAAAHGKGVIHRDIKPSNILFDSYGRPRILDFGLATIEGSDHLTRTGSTLGTVQYMSPEQTLGKQVNHRTDLFSMGVVLYELVTGVNPFARDNSIATAQAVLDQAPEPLARYRSNLPDLLQTVVSKLLEKDPALRYQSAIDVVADLKRMVRDVDSGVTSQGPSSAAISTSFSGKSLWRILVPLSALALVLVVAGGFWLWPDRADRGENLRTGSTTSAWKNSIAVLPFRDFSSEQNQEFFCDGITDAIIGRLSGLSGLKVISMTSVMRYKSPDRDLKKIGEELEVAAILEGSVQREGDRIRIRAQLINVEDDAHLWSDTYDKELQSIFSVQDEISHAIVGAMKIQLLGSEELALSRRGTESLEAYSAYMKGRFLWRKRSEEHIRSAIEFFEQAIESDSNYAEGFSGLADAWAVLPGYSETPLDSALPLAKEAAVRALVINNQLAEAQASMGLILWFEKDFEESERRFTEALELNPGYVWAHTWYSSLLTDMDRPEESLTRLEASLEIDPLNIVSLSKIASKKADAGRWDEAERMYLRILEIEPSPRILSRYAQFLYNRNRIEEAITQYNRSIELSPGYLSANRGLTNIYVNVGQFEQAMAQVHKYVEATGDSARMAYYLGELHFSDSRYPRAEDYLKEAVISEPDFGSAWHALARVQNQLGKVDQALTAAGRYIDLSLDDPYPYLLRGRIYLTNGRFESAIKDFEQAVQVNPEYWNGYESQVAAHLLQRNYDQAHTIIDMMASVDNDDTRSTAASLQAGALQMQGRFKEALSLIDSAISADSIVELTYMMRYHRLQKVFIYEELEQFELAIHELGAYVQSSIRNNPGDRLAWRDYYAQLLAQAGQRQAAIDSVESLKADIDASGRSGLIHAYWLARGSLETVSEEGDWAEGLRFMRLDADRMIYRLSRNYFQSQYMLARAELRMGEFEAAIETLTELLDNYTEERIGCTIWMAKAKLYLGQAYEGLGQTDNAIEQYESFMTQWKNADEGLPSVEDASERLAQLKS